MTQDAGTLTRVTERALASKGLTSYRIPSPYGWCMIGATSAEDAMSEAARSVDRPKRAFLEVWDKVQRKYIPA